ncbi:MAG: hypothetical protein NTY41_07595 [Proteobacteria bacterium]|nr:hypothetical protein [Pseudomonadota bacterium]
MAGVADKTDFRLLRFFTTASLVAFVIVAALLGYVFRALSIDGLLNGYENEHSNLAQQSWCHGRPARPEQFQPDPPQPVQHVRG